MIRRGSLVVAAAAWLALLGCGSTSAQTGGLFAYDAAAPLDVRETSSSVTGGVRTIELSYASPRGGRVPATLVLPERRAPVVLFQHGAGDASREDFRDEARELARSGLASLLIDAPLARPGSRNMTDFLRRQGQAWIRSAANRKLRTARQKQLARYLAHMRAVDAAEHVGRATAPILFQFGRRDELPARWFPTYVDAAPPAKRVDWYDAGHALCDCATRDRKAWLLERLGEGEAR